MCKKSKNGTKEKVKKFEDLKELFIKNKGKDILIDKKDDKYRIQVYNKCNVNIAFDCAERRKNETVKK